MLLAPIPAIIPRGGTVASEDSDVDFGTQSYNIRSKRIDVQGEVNMNTAPKLRDKLQSAMNRKPQVIIMKPI